MRKIPFAGVELTSQRVRGLRGTSELPGRPARTSVSTATFSGVFPPKGTARDCMWKMLKNRDKRAPSNLTYYSGAEIDSVSSSKRLQ